MIVRLLTNIVGSWSMAGNLLLDMFFSQKDSEKYEEMGLPQL
jgi:hypothetical protein